MPGISAANAEIALPKFPAALVRDQTAWSACAGLAAAVAAAALACRAAVTASRPAVFSALRAAATSPLWVSFANFFEAVGERWTCAPADLATLGFAASAVPARP